MTEVGASRQTAPQEGPSQEGPPEEAPFHNKINIPFPQHSIMEQGPTILPGGGWMIFREGSPETGPYMEPVVAWVIFPQGGYPLFSDDQGRLHPLDDPQAQVTHPQVQFVPKKDHEPK